MFRMIHTLFLSLALVLTSYSMAVARGQNPDIGTDMVICTGVEMTTVSIGPDGEPIETIHICPDAMAGFAAILATQKILAQPTAMQWRVTLPKTRITQPAETLSASARGPPLGYLKTK